MSDFVRSQRACMRAVVLAAFTSVALAVGAAGAVSGHESQERENVDRVCLFDIRPQALQTAMKGWSATTGFDWAHVGGSLEGIASPGVVGAVTPREALRQILFGTGMTYEVLPGGAIAIVPRKAVSVV